MPRYCIVNCLQVPVYIRQYDNNYTLADDWGSECDLSEHPHVTAAKQVYAHTTHIHTNVHTYISNFTLNI